MPSAICQTLRSRSSTCFRRIIKLMILEPAVLKIENMLPSSSAPEETAITSTSGYFSRMIASILRAVFMLSSTLVPVCNSIAMVMRDSSVWGIKSVPTKRISISEPINTANDTRMVKVLWCNDQRNVFA